MPYSGGDYSHTGMLTGLRMYGTYLTAGQFKSDKSVRSFVEMPKLRVIGAEACSGCENLKNLPAMPELMSIDTVN